MSMMKIKVIDQLSGNTESAHPSIGPDSKTPLDRIIDDAKNYGYDIVRRDVAEIHDEIIDKIYQSSVFLLINKEKNRHAVISQRSCTIFKRIYSLHSYNPEIK